MLSLDRWLVVNMGNVTGMKMSEDNFKRGEGRETGGVRGEPPHRGRLWTPTAGAMAK